MKSLCVFCGSSSGARNGYSDAARDLARVLVGEGIRLVYGGASVGVMGALADEVLAGGGEVIGVIPEGMMRHEVAHHGLTELRVVDSMHQRKALMAELSDGFVALPGGLGTFEELFEVYTWAQLGIHVKPVGLLNAAGYYDKLIEFLDGAVEERFLSSEDRSVLLVESDPRLLIEKFKLHRPPSVSKWAAIKKLST
ncbi:MAG: TIGR00730 family Rossman fold protein [Gemmatimonadales bacterium]